MQGESTCVLTAMEGAEDVDEARVQDDASGKEERRKETIVAKLWRNHGAAEDKGGKLLDRQLLATESVARQPLTSMNRPRRKTDDSPQDVTSGRRAM